MKKKTDESGQNNGRSFYGQVDERTKIIANAGDALAFRILLIALLLDVCYRSLFMKDAAWDIMALVISGGLISTVYQLKYKLFQSKGVFVKFALFAVILGAVIAVILVKFLKW